MNMFAQQIADLSTFISAKASNLVPGVEPKRQQIGARTRNLIIELMKDNGGHAFPAELAPHLGINKETVRGHLTVLVKQGRVLKKHGAIYPYRLKETKK